MRCVYCNLKLYMKTVRKKWGLNMIVTVMKQASRVLLA